MLRPSPPSASPPLGSAFVWLRNPSATLPSTVVGAEPKDEDELDGDREAAQSLADGAAGRRDFCHSHPHSSSPRIRESLRGPAPAALTTSFNSSTIAATSHQTRGQSIVVSPPRSWDQLCESPIGSTTRRRQISVSQVQTPIHSTAPWALFCNEPEPLDAAADTGLVAQASLATAQNTAEAKCRASNKRTRSGETLSAEAIHNPPPRKLPRAIWSFVDGLKGLADLRRPATSSTATLKPPSASRKGRQPGSLNLPRLSDGESCDSVEGEEDGHIKVLSTSKGSRFPPQCFRRPRKKRHTLDYLMSHSHVSSTASLASGSAAVGGTSYWSRSKRTVSLWVLIFIGLFVVGTVVVLSTVNAYFGVYPADVIDPVEVETFASWDAYNRSTSPSSTTSLFTAPLFGPKIPRIIHQTWKSDLLPQKWIPVRESCEVLHPTGDGEGEWKYMLWTDASSREFIGREYSWFLPTFDGYKYGIQRADAIRYFVLYHYGGVYMDLDIGCQKPMDPLLYFDVILPATIPVGVSNDLMFTSPRHPFMEQVIHNLMTFDHSYGTNYPTVMFSTGPMALSAIYGLWRRVRSPELGNAAIHPTPSYVGTVRILPQILYGKNAPPEQAPYAFFSHYYGSSWHTDDSGFVLWLGKSGKLLLYFGAGVAILGLAREILVRGKARKVGAGTLRRAAAGVISPRAPGLINTSGTTGPTLGLPFALDSWGEGGGRLRRLKRGELFFLPAYWMGDSSRPASPCGPPSPSVAGNGFGWASLLPSFVSDQNLGATGRYRPVPRNTMDLDGDEYAVRLDGLGRLGARSTSASRAQRRGWHSGSEDEGQGMPDDLEEDLPSYSPAATRPHPSPLQKAVAKLGELTGISPGLAVFSGKVPESPDHARGGDEDRAGLAEQGRASPPMEVDTFLTQVEDEDRERALGLESGDRLKSLR